MDASCFFVIGDVNPWFVESAELVAKLSETGFMTYSGKQFLTHWTYQLSATIADELPQHAGQALLVGVEIAARAPQCERPDGRVDQDLHA